MLRRRTLLLSALAALPAHAAPPPVVLELFTSQGCSSCPPADALLGSLAARPEVIALAFHVDYWNRLGWPDPFADRRWTDRQRAYARSLRQEVYTPALVVNGARMVVGSDARAVEEAMRATPAPRLSAALRADASGVTASYDPGAASVIAAVYDPRQDTKVRGGENGGRVLREYQVVRDVMPLDPARGQAHLPRPAAGQGIALLLSAADGRIEAATILRPGTTSPGATSPGATSPGATSTGATSTGATSTGSPPGSS